MAECYNISENEVILEHDNKEDIQEHYNKEDIQECDDNKEDILECDDNNKKQQINISATELGMIEKYEILADKYYKLLAVNNLLKNDCTELNKEIINNKIQKENDYKNKISKLINELTTTKNIYEDFQKENSILKKKYSYIKTENDKMQNEFYERKTYYYEFLLNQNMLLNEENKKIINELFELKKQLNLLEQQNKFNIIEHTILNQFHNKYKTDMQQRFTILEDDYKNKEDKDDGEDEGDVEDIDEEENDENEEEDEEEDDDYCESNQYIELTDNSKIKAFIENKVKKMEINKRIYKILNQTININSKSEVIKAYQEICKKYIKK